MVENKRALALILGGSSGLGLATAQKLAQEGYDLIIVHRDRKLDLEKINKHFKALRESGALCFALNCDATVPTKIEDTFKRMQQFMAGRKIKVLVHSIAKGNLKPMNGLGEPALGNADFQLTIQAMATSFYDWVKILVGHKAFADDARLMAFTSEGSHKAWSNYAAVSAAKAAMEAMVRSIALEFAPLGLKANCIQAGITDTKSLRQIPDHQELLRTALVRNPNQRLTTPKDVANVVYLLTLPEAAWITGTVIKADGGESLR